MAGNWKIITPEAGTNLITNPSFEAGVAGWTFTQAGAGATFTQDNTRALTGAYSAKITESSTNTSQIIFSSLTIANNETIVCSGYAYSETINNTRVLIFNTTTPGTVATATGTTVDEWERITCTWTNTTGSPADINIFYQNLGLGGDVWFDGLQAELNLYVTTYIDGDQPGCRWNGTAHASTSTRSAYEARGGVVQDLSDDLSFIVADHDGTGMPPVNNLSSPLALRPGSLFEAQTIAARTFSLNGSIVGSTPADFHSKKQGLISALDPSTVKINQRSQPRTFRYTGATVEKEIYAVYDGGLEKGLPLGWAEQEIRLRLRADDPLFYATVEGGAVLDTVDSATVSYVVARDGDTGLWDVLGPQSGGTVTDVRAIAEDATYIYIGGDFTNWNGTAVADYAARWNKSTRTWAGLNLGLNGVVHALAVAPNGDIYAGGAFTLADGAAANRIAKFNGTTWSALGTGLNNTVYAIEIAPDGTVYVGGAFTTAGGGAAASIAKWNGSAWSALGAGVDNTVYSLALDSSGDLYVGGIFANAGGSPAASVAKWNGSAWSALGAGTNGIVYSLLIPPDGTLYACGTFTTADGATANRVAKWNGGAWFPLGDGLNGTAYSLGFMSGNLYVSGVFTTAGGKGAGRLALWNGSTWTTPDILLPGTPNIYTIVASAFDHTLYFGSTASGTATFSGDTTITYTGTAPAYPVVTIKRTGGTSATLQSLRNETTGAILYFNYVLANGEELVIDTRPGQQSLTSSFRGNVYGDLLPNSDFGNFFLMPGNGGSMDNVITCFVNEVGSPTVTAKMLWRDAYISED